ncbi:hypothetical protein SISNIDRAFT_488020 [Sistotremastrum niveocremeum HHB9708]|uniref:Mixed lineage kinase domain-containing protein n=1 Tax=Sistotremastrum niveocremeum HHB9708 TaxID=1314777 RepID=A0A164RN97_9AGAM|nr:hypothetical protein SISNIDRAFT_488020 [Sistotremastrum niveocremeum HHB9708]
MAASSNALILLRLLEKAGEAIPHAGSIIKAIAGSGIVLLETAERVRTNKDDCIELAERAARYILDLSEMIQDPSKLPSNLEIKIRSFLSALKEVQETLEALGPEKSWWKRFGNETKVREEIKKCDTKLYDAWKLHIIGSVTILHREVASISEKMDSLAIIQRPSLSPESSSESSTLLGGPEEVR